MDDWNCQCRIDLHKIILSHPIKKSLQDQAESEKPNESCAILFGKEDIVSEIFPAKNIEESPVNFTISNEQLIDAYQTAENKGLEIIGIFHSHPNSIAIPSETDRKFMQSNPVTWVIYSGVEKDFHAFVLESDVKEIEIKES